MKLNKKFFFQISSLILFFLLSVNFCYASFLKQDTIYKVDLNAGFSGEVGGYTTTSNIFGLIQTVISAFLSIIGVLLLAYLLYAGYKWMTAHGDEEKVTAAKETIYRAIIGMIIIVGAYAISIFVMGRLQAGTLNNNGNSPATAPSAGNSPAGNNINGGGINNTMY